MPFTLRYFFSVYAFLFLIENVYSQTYSCDFQSPVNIPIYLSGNYGEPRSTHFHTGLDIRTNAQEGLPIYAVGDGYISRINLAPNGYGKALYITHPCGITSVYAHLQRLSPALENYIRKIQYSKKTYAIDTFLPKNLLPVRKGDFVAYSGNTGGSGGPHLHFETRDSKTEVTVNPQHFGFEVSDNIAPIVSQLKIYNRENSTQHKIAALKKVGNFYATIPEIIQVPHHVAFGVLANDKSLNSIGRNGIYTMQFFIDNTLAYEHKMDKISFEDWRYSYAYSDFEERKKADKVIHRCHILSCNDAHIYPNPALSGNIEIADNEVHQIRIILSDFAGNKTEIRSAVVCNEASKEVPKLRSCSKDFFIEQEDIRVFISKNTLFENANIALQKGVTVNGVNTYTIGSEFIPLKDKYAISLKIPSYLNPLKTVLVRYDAAKKQEKAFIGKVDNGFFLAETREFGTFYLKEDITPPTIRVISTGNKKTFSERMINCSISDNLSGIKSYNAYIDGVWTLFEYDSKFNHLFSILEKGQFEQGAHSFVLEVEDYANNVSRHESTIFIP